MKKDVLYRNLSNRRPISGLASKKCFKQNDYSNLISIYTQNIAYHSGFWGMK